MFFIHFFRMHLTLPNSFKKPSFNENQNTENVFSGIFVHQKDHNYQQFLKEMGMKYLLIVFEQIV